MYLHNSRVLFINATSVSLISSSFGSDSGVSGVSEVAGAGESTSTAFLSPLGQSGCSPSKSGLLLFCFLFCF